MKTLLFRDPLKGGSDEAPEMVALSGGTFRMGSPDNVGWGEEKPAHDVTLDAFAIGKYPVTVGEFRLFVEDTGYVTEAEQGEGSWVWHEGVFEQKKDACWRNPYIKQDDKHPVVCISWNDAKAYCKWLSEKTGFEYDLPTEAQWEYACRAGSESAYCFGDDESKLAKYAWHGDVSITGGTHPVGEKLPNDWHLHDMHGNVWEWCRDWSGIYSNGQNQGPESGDYKISRGGSWNESSDDCRSASRSDGDPSDSYGYTGFRISDSCLSSTRYEDFLSRGYDILGFRLIMG